MNEQASTSTSKFNGQFWLLLCVAVAFTVVTGVVYGRYSQRWGPVPDLLAKGRHVETLPKEFGDWMLLKEDTLSGVVQETLSCTGYVNREYVNRKSGANVRFAMYVGPSGPISVHTPEICYSSNDFLMAAPRRVTTLGGRSDEANTFWHLTFRPNGPTADVLRVYYGWSSGGQWKASESPRFEFGGQPALYKLQIATQIPQENADQDSDACQAFLADLLKSGWSLE